MRAVTAVVLALALSGGAGDPGIAAGERTWRVALSLEPPLPGGHLEIRLMQDELLLNDNCLAHFTSS